MTERAKNIIILGATSAIAEAAARIWAAAGANFVLVARDPARLQAVAQDLSVRGAKSTSIVSLDCVRANARDELQKMVETLGRLDLLLLAYGALGDKEMLEQDQKAVERLVATNFTSAVAWSLAASRILEQQRSGTLIVLGSVAGDRGRQSNFVYGATKAGLACLVEGIAHKLAPTGARAVVVKPGLVDTPMTAAFQKKGFLWTRPENVARIVARSAERGGPIVYAPPFWGWIMLIIRLAPTWVFNRLRI
jgi:decaprenylphospho-beta-D-erythro-pentofuranosid-2-ulose 2-reductase